MDHDPWCMQTISGQSSFVNGNHEVIGLLFASITIFCEISYNVIVMQFILISASMDFDYGIHETRRKNNVKKKLFQKRDCRTHAKCKMANGEKCKQNKDKIHNLLRLLQNEIKKRFKKLTTMTMRTIPCERKFELMHFVHLPFVFISSDV